MAGGSPPVAYYHQLAATKVGLILIASPSYGSKLANKLDLIARIYRHSVGAQLQWGSWSLQDLDARFKDLVHQRRIPDLLGVEAYENHFIVHRKWLPPKTYVVNEESAGRYFGAPRLLRQTDHFTAVKPDSINHPAHELLVDFFTNSFGVAADPTAAPPGSREALFAVAPPVRQGRRPEPASPEPADAALEILARDYQLVETLYRGHYSVVRKCVSLATGEACIVKQTDAALVSIPALTALQQMASLHIVRPRKVWSDADLVFEELEVVDGVLLSDIVAREIGGLSGALLECCHDDLLNALRDLRAAGLVYRDIHPDNLFLVRQPRPLVRAKSWREFATEAKWNHLLDASLTLPDETTLAANLGWIPKWMLADSTFVALADDHARPPVVHGTVTPEEQVNGRPVFASDIYALGATLYFGITGYHVPSYTNRQTGEPLQSLEHAAHPSVRFQRYLTETLALTPAERPGLGYELPQSSVINKFCGVLRLSEDAFVLCSTVETSNHIVNRHQLLAFLGTKQAAFIPYKDYWRSVAEGEPEQS